MSNLEKQALEFVKMLQHMYFEERNMETVLDNLDSQVSWFGAGKHEFCHGAQEAIKALEADKKDAETGFKITDSHYDTVCLSNDKILVFGEIHAESVDLIKAPLYHRLTVILKKEEDGLKLFHLHLSTPDSELEDDEFYVKSDRLDKSALQALVKETAYELEKRSTMYEALTKNVPGGVHNCLNDSEFTILTASEGFYSLTGYTEKEVKELFQNSFGKMIHPDDREYVLKTSAEQLKHRDMVEFEYRIIHKDGTVLWILDKARLIDDGKKKTFFCVMIDITDRKGEQEQLRLSLERHQVIMDQATDIIFEWDIGEDTLSFSQNWVKKFGYDAIDQQISERIPFSSNIYPDDIKAFVKIMEDTAAGIPYSETEFRIRDVSGCFIWCRIRATTQYDRDGHPVKAIGVIVDVDAEKKHEEELKSQAETDSLTGLYNKLAVKHKIECQLNGCGMEGSHALLVIDLDYFKNINDHYGHLSGDAVLSDIAGVLKKKFRLSDIIGRIGGDEFLVFMSNMENQKFIERKVQEVMEAFQNITPIEDSDYHLSSSIGIALYPKDAENYTDLYRCADQALYHVKNSGRNGYAFYQPSIKSHSASAVQAHIDSELGVLDQTLPRYTFQMLHEATNTKTAISQILEIVGRAYDISRIYILENTKDDSGCIVTFEWCNDAIAGYIDRQKVLSYTGELNGYQSCFQHHENFYCPDTSLLPSPLKELAGKRNVRTTLQCAMMDGRKIVGAIGFDECSNRREWAKDQFDSMALIANVISTFLLNYRQKEQIEKFKKQ